MAQAPCFFLVYARRSLRRLRSLGASPQPPRAAGNQLVQGRAMHFRSVLQRRECLLPRLDPRECFAQVG